MQHKNQTEAKLNNLSIPALEVIKKDDSEKLKGGFAVITIKTQQPTKGENNTFCMYNHLCSI